MYGIPNCDAIKKARGFLNQHNINYEFHDYKKQGVTPVLLQQWCKTFGYENVLNRRGTTWRKLDDETKASINEANAILLMQELPSMIKRPLLDTGEKLVLGFNQSEYQSLL
ncbi:MAG: ArsC family reductase [SAR86 cluster bacterium]|uniref:ArsC family reductase n=1 Tax=SAR86 cluster bacterium TaxID=2030880 RepID=A0A2A5CAS5_9GAMM|nr:ArsC family reductase [Gammaproteobacteria bacterium AH-315-E17]PCJ40466.1 MAG: ArsC family reductase [SAR86 cluster bacterium]